MILSRVTEGTGPVKSGNLRMQGAKSGGDTKDEAFMQTLCSVG